MTVPSGNYQFAFNGWAFGGTQSGVQILEVTGLEDQPDLRTQDDSGGYRDGQFSGRDFLNGRTVVFTLQIMNDGVQTMQEYLAELKDNLIFQQTGTGLLQFQLPGRAVHRLNARVRKRAIKIDPDYVYGKSLAYVEFFCPDPRVYDDAESGAVLIPGANVGRVYNRVYPLVYTTPISGATSSVSFTNEGNITVFPLITISGACVLPQIVNSSTGQALSLNITTSATDVIVIDTDLRSITYNGNPARNLLINTSEWFGLPPGTTTLGIIAVTTSGATCSITYRNGYV
jgi:hypothetical protein